MKKRNWLLAGILGWFFMQHVAQAQNNYGCYTDEHASEQAAKFPGQYTSRAVFEQQIQNFISQHPNTNKTNGAVIKIPVVIHVVSETGCNGISKAQILNGLEIVNKDFRRQNADTINTRAVFKSYAADTEIEFVLARLDPQGNPTDGINRVTSFTANAPRNPDDVKTAVPAWPASQYFNIWLVDKIYSPIPGSDVLGYAKFPTSNFWNTYGVVLVHNQWGALGAVSGTSAISNGRRATHEIAHCLNLLHDFDMTCISTDHCSTGDLCGDTPPVSIIGAVSGCNLSQNTCSNDVGNCSPYLTDVPDQVENFMSMSSCQNMFTMQQATRMRNALVSIPHLSNMISASNAFATGIDPNVPVGTLAPKPYFCADTRSVCAGNSVTFSDNSYQGTVAFRNWSFPGGTPATSTAQNPVVTYNTPGKYAVTFSVSDGTGNSYPLTVTNYIEVVPATNLINVAPPNYYVDSFEEPTFPESATVNRNWGMENFSVAANPQTWTRTSTAYSHLSMPAGTHSLYLNGAATPDGTVSTLITPNFTVQQGGHPSYVFMDMAYAKRVAQPADELRVYASDDCGATWSPAILTLAGNQLVTNGGAIVSGNFIPVQAEWRREQIIHPSGNFHPTYTPHTMFKIEFVSNGGGNIYLDNFTIGSILGTNEALAAQNKIRLYPNPVTSATNLEFELKAPEKVTVKILDLVGNTIYSNPETTFSAGKHSVLLADKMKNQSRGMYLVQLQMGGKVYNTKLLLQ